MADLSKIWQGRNFLSNHQLNYHQINLTIDRLGYEFIKEWKLVWMAILLDLPEVL
jgi:hypothetical protein